MNKPIRVHQIAKDSGCESRDVVDALHQMGHEEIKSASSNVPQELIEELKKRIKPFPVKEISVKGLWNQTDITLDLSQGLVSIIGGPNGVGKTTLLILIKEIFQNRNYLEETAPLRQTEFKEIKIEFAKLGTLKISKPKNQLKFDVNRKRVPVTAKQIYYQRDESILVFLDRSLEEEHHYDSKNGKFISVESGKEVILTDVPKLIANIGNNPNEVRGWTRHRSSLSRVGIGRQRKSNLQALKMSLERRWGHLDQKLLEMLECIKVTDIPTRRERALNISTFEEQSLTNNSLETIEGISIKLREQLNEINEGYLVRKNAENAELGDEFLKTAFGYDPIEKSIEIKYFRELFSKENDEKRRKLRENVDRLQGQPEKKSEMSAKIDEFLLFELINSAKWLTGSLTPSIESFGEEINSSTQTKLNLKKSGYFYHAVEQEVDFKKITASPNPDLKAGKQNDRATFKRFFAAAFLTPYLKTIAGSNSTSLDEIQLFARKTENFLSMVNEQYGLLHKKITIKQQTHKKGLIEVRSTIDDRQISLEVLSSGEKHVIILCYLLSFVEEGHLLLIDEPEISMHVSWKKKFCGNLQECLEPSGSKAIIATHSPTLTRQADPKNKTFFEPSN
jgi:ABC-type Mn2+/Zn2+ transport system ATPase subunit